MDGSIFLARLLGPTLLVVGAGLLLNRAAFAAVTLAFLDNPALIYLSGILALPAGLAIILTHNIWTPDWRLLVTLFGWAAAAAGAVRILAPTQVAGMGRRIGLDLAFTIGGGVWLAFGAVLTFCGFFR